MKVLITGATGFVGSHALEALMDVEGIEVIAACRDRAHLLPSFHGEVREGDIRDREYIKNLLDDIDVLCHAATWGSLYGHKQASRELYYEPTIRLYQMALDKNVGKIINISTTSAAAPDYSQDPMSQGIPRKFWPHLNNIIRIENFLREHASSQQVAINLRLGIFVGRRYGLGILPILLPRLKTHLVPWVQGGGTHLPLIDGRDIGQAIRRAAMAKGLVGYEAFNIVGKKSPSVRQVIKYIHEQYGYPEPHFSVPFFIAYPFAGLMEKLDRIVPWDPLVTRSIVHLLEETHANNRRAEALLGYRPKCDWRDSVEIQVDEIHQRQAGPMGMTAQDKPWQGSP